MTIEEIIASIGFLLARYLHIVCTALLVGGTLFYEMVVPIAVGDMSEGQQLAIMGRSRWVFRWIVWLSGTVLLISGVFSTIRHWSNYTENGEDPEITVVESTATTSPSASAPMTKIKLRSGWWWVAHASTGCISVLIAFSLTWGRTPPAHPVQWMRLNLVILMIVIFLGSVARQIRLAAVDRQTVNGLSHPYYPPAAPPSEGDSN